MPGASGPEMSGDARRGSPGPVLVVSDVAPDEASANGFAPRLSALLAALAARSEVELVVPAAGGSRATPSTGPGEWRRTVVDVGRSRLAGPLFKLYHYTADPLPYMCEVRRYGAVSDVIAARRPALVVLYLPYLAHLARSVPVDVPVVFALEEGWERMYATGAAGPARRWARRSEEARLQRLYQAVSRRAAAVVVISEAERRHFERLVEPSLLEVVPHGVDVGYFSPAGTQDEDLDVGVFGDLTQGRNLSAAIDVYRAAEAEPSDAPPWRWAFVGRSDGPLRAAVRSTTDVVTGLVPDLRPWYERSRVVLVPATQGTGVKTTLLQAWAMGRPVVASRFATAGVAVADGVNALVAGSPSDAVHLCGRLLGDESLRRRLGRAGRETALRHHQLADVAGWFADVCRRAAGDVLEAGR